MKVETRDSDTVFEVLNTPERASTISVAIFRDIQHAAFILQPDGVTVRLNHDRKNQVLMDKHTFKRFAQWAADAAKDL